MNISNNHLTNKNMITKFEYERAKLTIELYEKQMIPISIKNDPLLCDVLSKRTFNMIEKNLEDMVYLSDLVNLCRMTGDRLFFLKFKNCGHSMYSEISDLINVYL